MASKEYSYELKIPKERIAVLIGKKGEIKKEIEEKTRTEMDIDSKEGDVFIFGKEALNLYTSREIVKAVGRGFNPGVAELLLKQDYILDILEIEEFVNTNNLEIPKGRLIGTGGKARRTIETLTGCYLSIYGKTVGIIGEMESVPVARKAVERLLGGAKHGNIYKWLEKQRKQNKTEELI